MKNIRGKSVKKSRDWIQEKKVRWFSFGLKNSTQQTWNAGFAGPCQEEREGCQTWLQVHWKKEKRQILKQQNLWKIFYDWLGALSIPYFDPDSRFMQIFSNISSFRGILDTRTASRQCEFKLRAELQWLCQRTNAVNWRLWIHIFGGCISFPVLKKCNVRVDR